MKQLLTIFTDKKENLRVIVSCFIFIAVSLVFREINMFNTVMISLMPENAIPPVLGLYLGPAGAVGAALGSVVVSLIRGINNPIAIAMKLALEFFYAYVPYKLWYTLNIKNRCDIPNLNNIKSISRYIYIILIDFICVYFMNEITKSFINNTSVNLELMALNIFSNFNYVIMIGVAALVAISTTDIRPHIPKNRHSFNINVHYDIIVYAVILMEIMYIYSVREKAVNGFSNKIILVMIYCFMIGFVISPITNEVNIVEISKMKGVFSLKGKVTIGFLMLSIAFISVLVITAHIALTNNSYTSFNTYKKIILVIGFSGYFIFIVTLLALYYVQKKITEPIQVLFKVVEDFTRTQYNSNNNYKELIKKCDEIKTGDEIEELVIAFEKMMSDLINYVKNLSKATAKIEKEAAELSVAHKIQAAMVPCKFPAFPDRKDFDIFGSMTPAKEVSGDFYDFFLINDDFLVFVIADVSGKGVPAALFMMTAKTTIKNLLTRTDDISEVVQKVNNDLCENNDTFMFVTAFIGVVDLKNGVLVYVNAGHNPPLLKHENGTFDYLDVKNNCILAIMPDAEFEKQTINIRKGDILFTYTDGITEAMNSEGNLFGISRLKETLNNQVRDDTELYRIIPMVEMKIAQYCDGQEQSDDITMLAFKYFGEN